MKLEEKEIKRHLHLALECKDDRDLRKRVEVLYQLMTKKKPRFVSSRPIFIIKSNNREVEVQLSRRDAKRVEEIFYEFLDRKKALRDLEGDWAPVSLSPKRINPALFSFTFKRTVPIIEDTPVKKEKKDKSVTKKAVTVAGLSRTMQSMDEQAQKELLERLMKKIGLNGAGK